MACGDFERLLNEYLDARGTLAPEAQAFLEAHAAECATCRTSHARYIVLNQAIRALGRPPALTPGFTARVLETLAQESTPGTFLFPRRRIAAFATAAVVLLAVGVIARDPGAPHRGAKVARSPVVVAPRPEIDARDLSEALADATSATWKLASETSAPAARFGREILETTELPGSSASFSLVDGVHAGLDVAPGSGVFQSLGERVNAGVAPLSGTARHAFSFLLGPSDDPKKPEPVTRPDNGA